MIFMTYFTAGCRKQKGMSGVYTLNLCEDIIDNLGSPECTKQIARKALDKWNNKVLDPEPILIHAGYGQDPNYGNFLFLTMLDEDFDIAGFIVKELHRKSESNVIVIEEKYSVFPETKIGDFQYLDFSERSNLSQIKDEKAWDNYLNAGAEKEVIYRRGEHPIIWLSLPNKPTVEVEIAIYDYKGNQSEPVCLEYGFPVMKKRSTISKESIDR
jgi:hypothetical protein